VAIGEAYIEILPTTASFYKKTVLWQAISGGARILEQLGPAAGPKVI